MRSFAWWSVRHRWRVIGGWVALVLLLAGISLAVGGAHYDNNVTLPSGYGSQRAQALLRRDFPRAAGDQDQIVAHVTTGTVTSPAVRRRLDAMLARVARLPHVVSVAGPYGSRGQAISRDARTAFAVVTFDAQASDLPAGAVTTVIATARAARSPTLRVALLGQAIENSESSGPGRATAVGLGVAVLVLLVLFGSVIAMAMPLVTVGVAIGAGISVNAMITHVLNENTATLAIALMIALGVGIDYSLFIVSRFRGLLAEGREPDEAAAGSVRTSGRAVLFAGGIVVLALLMMLILGVSITTGIAVGAAVEVAFTMAAALTLLPAVLSLLGARVNSLRMPGRHPAVTVGTRLSAWATLVRRTRWATAGAVVIVLVVLALPLLSMRLGQSDASADPPGSTTRQAYQMLSDGFGPGFTGPLVVAATLPAPSDAAVLRDLAGGIRSEPGVASVTVPQVGPGGTVAALRVYPATSPQSAATSDLVSRLRGTIIPRATAGTGVVAYIGGPTATYIDLSNLLGSRLLPFIAAVLVLGIAALLVVFRSVAIPLTAAVLNLLSIGAALGVVVAVFQYGWTGLPAGPVDFALPVMMFAIVFGLSTDYQVFLLSRVQEEWHLHHDNARAVHDGMTRVSGVITGAAVIMIAVFASFVPGGQRLLQEIGTGFAVAVALDAFLIRFALVPALMYILGDWNWRLPSWLNWLPLLHVEPAEAGTPGQPPAPRGTALASGER